MNESHKHPLTLIAGGKEELERKKRILFSTPEVLEQKEFENLCDSLGLRLADVEPLIARRVRLRAKDALERNALLAIINGDLVEGTRLTEVIKKRNTLKLRLISTP
jgi:hypothetical protein|uniref:Uncharacterized protein n=1 Tax=mine drainage metagenome TaxID=410659 RepID=E6QW66_9ZZZZ